MVSYDVLCITAFFFCFSLLYSFSCITYTRSSSGVICLFSACIIYAALHEWPVEIKKYESPTEVPRKQQEKKSEFFPKEINTTEKLYRWNHKFHRIIGNVQTINKEKLLDGADGNRKWVTTVGGAEICEVGEVGKVEKKKNLIKDFLWKSYELDNVKWI